MSDSTLFVILTICSMGLLILVGVVSQHDEEKPTITCEQNR